MIINKRAEGNKGEQLAVKELKKHGYKILDRNYVARRGEIDIVAFKKPYYVFVEVKSRNGNDFGRPIEAVTEDKIRHLVYAGKEYLFKKGLMGQPVRFDVVEIIEGKVEIFENAFEEN